MATIPGTGGKTREQYERAIINKLGSGGVLTNDALAREHGFGDLIDSFYSNFHPDRVSQSWTNSIPASGKFDPYGGFTPGVSTGGQFVPSGDRVVDNYTLPSGWFDNLPSTTDFLASLNNVNNTIQTGNKNTNFDFNALMRQITGMLSAQQGKFDNQFNQLQTGFSNQLNNINQQNIAREQDGLRLQETQRLQQGQQTAYRDNYRQEAMGAGGVMGGSSVQGDSNRALVGSGNAEVGDVRGNAISRYLRDIWSKKQ